MIFVITSKLGELASKVSFVSCISYLIMVNFSVDKCPSLHKPMKCSKQCGRAPPPLTLPPSGAVEVCMKYTGGTSFHVFCKL